LPWSFNMTPSVIALDVGGTSIKSGVVAPGGRVVRPPLVTPVDPHAAAEALLGLFTDVIARHAGEADTLGLRGVCFGFPSPFDYANGVCWIRGVEKFESLYGVDLRAELGRRLCMTPASIRFRNDAEAAVVGEARYGAGRPFRRSVGITLGTGLGSAFVEDGEPVEEEARVPPEGKLFPQIFRGHRADDWFSRRGLEGRLREAGLPIDVRAAAGAARAGNAVAAGLFQRFGEELGAFLAPFAERFSADVVLVLGRIAGAFDLFGPAMRSALAVPVLTGSRPDDAALLGAAEMLLGDPAPRSPIPDP
jgi:glucokinase